jgi:hypothetical protein
MSGRGRGRGRGGAQSASKMMLQRSVQEAGLDVGNLRSLQADITKPQLFPDYEWHSHGHIGFTDIPQPKRSTRNVFLINKSRALSSRYKSSPYFAHPTQESDIERHGRSTRPVEPDVRVLDNLGKLADSDYFPEEFKLMQGVTKRSGSELEATAEGDGNKGLSLEELAKRELKRRRETLEGDQEDDGNHSEIDEQEDEEEDEVADYTTNYYASDDESDGGGGGDEATF